MNILFIHQNFPGQFKHIMQDAALRGHTVVGIGEENAQAAANSPSIRIMRYPKPAHAGEKTHHYLKPFESAVRRGQTVLRLCLQLQAEGFYPDLVCCHPGWGESLFIKDIFPNCRLCCYFEFFYSADNSDVDFDHETPIAMDDRLRLRMKNTTQLHALESSDLGISPTHWQKSRYPTRWQNRIHVLHEGIDTSQVRPNPQATFTLPNGRTLSADDEVITFVNRNLEPYRGFPVFMRSLPAILNARPQAQVLVLGGNEVSYGRPPPPPHKHWKEKMLAELGDTVDWQRVHFLGKIPYVHYLSLLQVSSLHVYLTYPFVLSWSFIEAMSTGCLLLASATAPVQEVLEDDKNGFLFPFFDNAALADKAIYLLSQPRGTYQAQREAARQTILDRFDLQTMILPAYRALLGI